MFDAFFQYLYELILVVSSLTLLVTLFFPLPFKQFVQIAVVLGIAFSTFHLGKHADEVIWKQRVSDLKTKVAVLEVEAGKENIKIVEKIVFKEKIIKVKGDEIIKYIEKDLVKYDATCIIPPEVIDTHNKATE